MAIRVIVSVMEIWDFWLDKLKVEESLEDVFDFAILQNTKYISNHYCQTQKQDLSMPYELLMRMP